MEKITPFLWFDDRAEEAINFYIAIFKNSKISRLDFYGDEGPGAKGAVKSAAFSLAGQQFYALDGGPAFSFTPAISFFVNCDSEEEADALWNILALGGKVLMAMGAYPFSAKYGWVEDKFGVSWQINLMSSTQKIVPLLMYTGKQNGRAEEAMNFYTSIFPDSEVVSVSRYEAGEGGTLGSVKHGRFLLHDQLFLSMDSSLEHDFNFTPAISFFVSCETQAEVDAYWEKLSAGGGEPGVCGWLTDKFGISWQIVPTVLGELLRDPDPLKAKRVMQSMLAMTKLDIATLHQAYEGKA